MRNYSLLSDHDFEQLVADLLREETGVRWESFARGRDGGVDLRTLARGDLEIVQCKHMQASTFSSLRVSARKEASNLAKAKNHPASYKFFTTQTLTPGNKDELVSILSRWIGDSSNIFGANDIEGLLNKYPEVERAHTKLWLASAGQLDAQLHSGTWARSKQLLEDLKFMLPRYVEIAEFGRAKTMLADNKVIIISGPPGIGKTTLARLLLADTTMQGYEAIQISSDIDEGDRVWSPERKQAFYYDDFLGETFLDSRLTKNEDKRIANFIRRCDGATSKLFILTTREYILRQAESIYTELRNSGALASRLVLEIERYSSYERAQIFYNHIWHSGQLDGVARKSLLKSKSYLKIIDHPNYNPRLVEYITGLASHRLVDEDKRDYIRFALNILDRPDEIWRSAFTHQLDGDCKDILLALASSPSLTIASDLEAAFLGVAHARGATPGHGAFRSALRILDDSFIKSRVGDGVIYLSFANPSVGDFVREWLIENPYSAIDAVKGAVNFEQLIWLNARIRSFLDIGLGANFDTVLASVITALWSRSSVHDAWFLSYSEMILPVSGSGTPERRLEFLCQVMDRSSALAATLETWFLERLDEVSSEWLTTRSLYSGPVRLVGALQKYGRLNSRIYELAIQAQELHLRSVSDWQELIELEELDPEMFTEARSRRIREEFKGWVNVRLTDDIWSIADIEELDSIKDATVQFGFDIDEDMYEYAHSEISIREEDDEDSGYTNGGVLKREMKVDYGASIDNLFARLDEF